MTGRWKVALINWRTWEPGVPHAVTYCSVDGEAHMEKFHDSWAAAIAWMDQRGPLLLGWAEKLAALAEAAEVES